ncbi:MAG: acyltransferase family protein [Hymenobacter sp.]
MRIVAECSKAEHVAAKLPASFVAAFALFMQRNTTVDFTRLIAAYGVIALHVPVSTRGAQWLDIVFWPLCVPFFYVVSLVYFVAGLAKAEANLRSVFARSWHRLVVPYLAWTAIYTGLLVAKTLLTHGGREFSWWRILLYGESAVRLYFLPTLLLLQGLALALHLLLRPALRTPGWLLLLGSLAYLGWGIHQQCFGGRYGG